jgi:hypothetical protein
MYICKYRTYQFDLDNDDDVIAVGTSSLVARSVAVVSYPCGLTRTIPSDCTTYCPLVRGSPSTGEPPCATPPSGLCEGCCDPNGAAALP